MALEHHIQIHEDPLVLLLIPRAPHLLHGTAEGLALSLGRRGPMGHGRGLHSMGRAGWAHLDSDDVPCLPEAHLPHLAASAAAHLPQVLQVVDLRLVALARRARAGDPVGLCPHPRPTSPSCVAPTLPGATKGSALGYLAPDGQVARLLHDLLQLLVNLDAERRGSECRWRGVLTNVRLPQPPTRKGFHRAHQRHPEAGPAPPDLPTIHQEAHLSMLRGVNKVDGSPSMWRGRAGGVGCCGELSEDGERLPPSLASGSCRAGGW